jgi:hypothetical protein
LALNLHKITGGVLLDFIAFYSTCRLNGSAEEEEFLSQGSLSRIRM